MRGRKLLPLVLAIVVTSLSGVGRAQEQEQVIRLGMIGLDTSHVIAFTSYLNNPKNKTGCRVVAGFPGGSPDFPASANRVDKFTEQLRDKYGLEIVDSIEELCEKVDGILLESVVALADLFEKEDCSLCEVNPLVVTGAGDVVALDSKINFDSNGAPRHPEWAELQDRDEEDARELEAAAAGLSYVSLDGTIGCLVNGAGLAMSTMDIIKHTGGEPANFLDVGGGATKEQVEKAFSMILSSPKVKGIFVNIFGGIMKCDVIAEGVVAAARSLGLEVPLVVRLEGTNVEAGKKILAESGLQIESASNMADGAKKIVAAVS